MLHEEINSAKISILGPNNKQMIYLSSQFPQVTGIGQATINKRAKYPVELACCKGYIIRVIWLIFNLDSQNQNQASPTFPAVLRYSSKNPSTSKLSIQEEWPSNGL